MRDNEAIFTKKIQNYHPKNWDSRYFSPTATKQGSSAAKRRVFVFTALNHSRLLYILSVYASTPPCFFNLSACSFRHKLNNVRCHYFLPTPAQTHPAWASTLTKKNHCVSTWPKPHGSAFTPQSKKKEKTERDSAEFILTHKRWTDEWSSTRIMGYQF